MIAVGQERREAVAELLLRRVECRHRLGRAAAGRDRGTAGPPASARTRSRSTRSSRRRARPARRHSTSARPPEAAIVFSLALVKKPIRRLSGDQNGSTAPSASSSRRAAIESSDRTHSCVAVCVTRADDERHHRAVGRNRDAGRIRIEARRPAAAARRARASRRSAPVRGRGHSNAATPAVTTTPASAGQRRATSDGARGRRGRRRRGAPARVSSSSSRASPIALRRLRGSFSRQRRSSRRTDAGRSGGQRLPVDVLLAARSRA